MLMPKKVKYRKQQRGRMRGKAWRGSDVSFGDYGLKALEPCWLTDRQIEAARIAMTRFVKRGGKVWVRVFPEIGSDVSFGDYGLKALEPCWLTDRQIEAARIAMTRFVKRGGKVWVRVFP